MFKKKKNQNHRICNTSKKKKKVLMIQIKLIYTKKSNLRIHYLKNTTSKQHLISKQRGYIVYWYVN